MAGAAGDSAYSFGGNALVFVRDAAPLSPQPLTLSTWVKLATYGIGNFPGIISKHTCVSLAVTETRLGHRGKPDFLGGEFVGLLPAPCIYQLLARFPQPGSGIQI